MHRPGRSPRLGQPASGPGRLTVRPLGRFPVVYVEPGGRVHAARLRVVLATSPAGLVRLDLALGPDDRIVLVAELPRLPTGKLLRRRLREMLVPTDPAVG